jgi:hypothetical protein
MTAPSLLTTIAVLLSNSEKIIQMTSTTFNTDRLYGFLPSNIKGIDSLAKLALDMRW